LAKQLTVFDLLLGAGHPLCRQLENAISSCEIPANRLAALLAERRAFVGGTEPLFPAVATADHGAAIASDSSDFSSFLSDEWALVKELSIERQWEKRPWFSSLTGWAATRSTTVVRAQPVVKAPQPVRTCYEPFPYLR
jgi:hypothetical protein